MTNDVIDATWNGVTGPDDADVDLAAYLGTEFRGYARAFFKPGTYSVSVAAYSTTSQGWTQFETYTQDIAGVTSITEGTQKTDAKNGQIYGIYPAPSLST